MIQTLNQGLGCFNRCCIHLVELDNPTSVSSVWEGNVGLILNQSEIEIQEQMFRRIEIDRIHLKNPIVVEG